MQPDVNSKRELVVVFEDDFKFLLWKHSIYNVIYVGDALDECILYRGYGIMNIRGERNLSRNINVYVVPELVQPMRVPSDVDPQVQKKVLLDSYSATLGVN